MGVGRYRLQNILFEGLDILGVREGLNGLHQRDGFCAGHSPIVVGTQHGYVHNPALKMDVFDMGGQGAFLQDPGFPIASGKVTGCLEKRKEEKVGCALPPPQPVFH